MSSDVAVAAPAPPAAAAAVAPSVASKSNAKSKRSPLNVSAVHVLKSALISVIGAQCSNTQAVDYAHSTKAELTVSYEGDTLTPEVYNSVEARCNELIQQNIAIAELPGLPPADLANCEGPRTERTGELRVLKLLKMRNRKNQKGYEFSFVVQSAAEELIEKNAAAVAATNSKKPSAVQQAAVAASAGGEKKKTSSAAAPVASTKKVANDYIVEATQAIFNQLILPAVAKLQSGATPATSATSSPASSASPTTANSAAAAALTPAELARLKTDLLPALESHLVMFANQAYTRGFTAKQQGNGNVDMATLL